MHKMVKILWSMDVYRTKPERVEMLTQSLAVAVGKNGNQVDLDRLLDIYRTAKVFFHVC
jgi:hypothetical protein